jgi:hypothetical protein
MPPKVNAEMAKGSFSAYMLGTVQALNHALERTAQR